jgi:hypothetical protein
MSTHQAFDASIPVLTEVFQDQPSKKHVAVHAEAVEPAADEVPLPAGPQAPAASGRVEPDWAALERGLTERIMAQLDGEVDVALEQKLRDSIAAALEAATAGLAAELRASLRESVGQIVAGAVAHELARLETPPD